MDWNRLVRLSGVVVLTLIGCALPLRAAFAQEVTEDYIIHHLGPAAEQMQAAGVDGSGDSTPAIIGISQRWGIEPAYWISVDEVRWLVRSAREDRVRERMASFSTFSSPTKPYLSQLTLTQFGIVNAGLTCGQAKEKARSAQRLADALGRLSQLDAVGTGLVGALSQGAMRFAAPLGFATMVTGMASLWANQLASAYRNAPCLTGGDLWRTRPNVTRTSLFQDLFRDPLSSPGPCGSLFAALRIGRTSRPHAVEPPSYSRWVFGHSRSL